MTGIILKGIGGFYYVKTEAGLITCKCKGIFRKAKIIPAVGDRVVISHTNQEDGLIEEILPRRNHLFRPPVSNIDKLFIITSVSDPAPNPFLIDKTIAIAEVKNIEPVLVITKTDLMRCESLMEIYIHAGIRVLEVASLTADGIEAVRAELGHCISAFTGNSGVGKSTLLNALMPELALETGETSKKLGRGRHTTRHVELFPVGNDGYVADTPGFSTLDTERFEPIYGEELPYGFREFAPYLASCKFSSCTHSCEKGCAVLQAVEEGKIHPSRMESYIAMYNEVKDVKEWQKQKNV